MFIVVKKKNIILVFTAILLVLALTGTGIALSQTKVFAEQKKYTVVIDAGHGGADGGVTGKNGLVEAELNLMIAKTLEEKLSRLDFRVVMTRKDEKGLYGDSLDNFKARDFAARKKIITEADPDALISIHANKFPQSEARRGIQVFYNPASEEGKELAVCLQDSLNLLNEKYVGKTFSPLKGEYFMLNCTKKPSVIVECGFLSSAEDEKLLATSEYREEIADAITIGLTDYYK